MNVRECVNVENVHFMHAGLYGYHSPVSLPNKSVWFALIFFTGQVNFQCLFGSTSHSVVKPVLLMNPYICDCLDFEIYRILRYFPHTGILDRLYCDRPLEYRGELVHTLYFIRLMNCDNTMWCVVKTAM